MPAADLHVRRAGPADRSWVVERVAETWGLPIVSRGRVCDLAAMEMLVCTAGGERAGLATYELHGDGSCELVTIIALRRAEGVGTALLEAVAERARRHGCRRLWLITTNDNLGALRFYQRRGMHLVAVRAGAMDAVRALKPSVPAIGEHGIPLRDELVLELDLTA